MSEDGIATRMVAYIARGGAANHNVKCAIYEYDSGGNHVLVAETLVVVCGALAWYQFEFPSFVQLLNGVEYILCAIGDDGASGTINLRYTASSGSGISKAATYPTFPDPLSSVTGDSNLYAIFCHYIPGSATGLHFGNETVESTTTTIESTINGGIETMGGVDGVANAIVAYIQFAGFTGTDAISIKCALYTSGADPALIAESDELVIDPYNSHAGIINETGWYIFPLPTAPALSPSTDYVIAVWCLADASGTVYTRFVSSGGSGMELENLSYGAWPDPMNNTNAPGFRQSIFVDYVLAPTGGVRLLQLNGGMKEITGGMRG